MNFIGGQTNLEMFTFTAGYGYEVKNGKPGRMFRDIVLSGNVFQTLKEISMIGNDRKMYGGLGGCGKGGQVPLPVSFGGPHMLIKNVLIGGAQ
jgi:TldD protein